MCIKWDKIKGHMKVFLYKAFIKVNVNTEKCVYHKCRV